MEHQTTVEEDWRTSGYKSTEIHVLENFTDGHTQRVTCMNGISSTQGLGTDTGEALSKGTGENAHLMSYFPQKGLLGMRRQPSFIGPALWWISKDGCGNKKETA